MRISSNLFLLALSVLVALQSNAQQAFKEGYIVYAVTIDPPANQEGIIQYHGKYTITVKDKQIKKDLKMDNGFGVVILLDEAKGTAYSLKEGNGSKYAIQLDASKIAERRKKYENYQINEKGTAGDIAGIAATSATIKYKDGTVREVAYGKAVLPEVMLFEYMNGLAGLPLQFDHRNDEGMMMHFRAEVVKEAPVENKLFKLPEGYKVISNEEYQQLSKR